MQRNFITLFFAVLTGLMTITMQAGIILNVRDFGANKYAVGNYSGKYTNSRNTAHGFEWVDTSNSTLQLNTKTINSEKQRIYVYAPNSGSITGEFIGSTFYRYDAKGVSVSILLSLSVVDGYVQINGSYGGTVTGCKGEVRLM